MRIIQYAEFYSGVQNSLRQISRSLPGGVKKACAAAATLYLSAPGVPDSETRIALLGYQWQAINSTSTSAPLGRAAAATQLRAGLEMKYFS